MQMLNVTNLPIYLPADNANVPVGDPLVCTITIAAPGVVTVPGYDAPVINDLVAFSTTGALPTGLTVGTVYYVVATVSADTFSVSATKGGGAITTSGSQSGVHTIHLLSRQAYSPLIPFKPGNTAVCLNLSGGALVLQTAPDSGGVAGNPQGPGSWTTAPGGSVGAGAAALVQLNNDWLRVSTAATLVLLQN